MHRNRHQYVDRVTSQVKTERLFGDRMITLIYSQTRERMPWLFRALTSGRASSVLAQLNYDLPLSNYLLGGGNFVNEAGVDLSECLEPKERLNTPRKIFERRIRYWETRPMTEDERAVVSPADSRVLVGSLCEVARVFIKEKFFSFAELLGGKEPWGKAFQEGDFAIFRLTPEHYHYNHVPVSGRVVDFYEIEGTYHSCNPAAVVAVVTPYSKNKRVVTVIDTDVEGGTGVGRVAMVEIVALMIGEIQQAYSKTHYHSPCRIEPGMFLEKGQPKSLFRPGSSTDVLLFEPDRITWAEDLVRNQLRQDVESRFTKGFGRPLIETEVRVRGLMARAKF